MSKQSSAIVQGETLWVVIVLYEFCLGWGWWVMTPVKKGGERWVSDWEPVILNPQCGDGWLWYRFNRRSVEDHNLVLTAKTGLIKALMRLLDEGQKTLSDGAPMIIRNILWLLKINALMLYFPHHSTCCTLMKWEGKVKVQSGNLAPGCSQLDKDTDRAFHFHPAHTQCPFRVPYDARLCWADRWQSSLNQHRSLF